MEKLALVISPAGQVERLDISENSLSQLQNAVGGLIEAVDIKEDLTMWVNEEFLFSGNEPNLVATAYFEIAGGTYPILGSVVFTGGSDSEGYTMGLSDRHAENIALVADMAVTYR
jgi:hypothetical protein